MTAALPAGARLTVDLAALVANWRDLDARARPGGAAAVVKADAYGLGAEAVATALHAAGCRRFFVAFPAEGAALAPLLPGAEILVLNAIDADGLAACRDRALVPVLNSPAEAAWWLAEAGGAPSALMVDTGMNRLGVTVAEALALAGLLSPRLLLSHLACGDEPGHEANERQRSAFAEVCRAFPEAATSLAASGGLFIGPDYASSVARPGIALYGGSPGSGPPLRVVATLAARITQLRLGRAGDTVSYGATATLARPTPIAVAAIGYGDGLPRALSGSGVALRGIVAGGGVGIVNGARAPILGRITMDATLFDISGCGPVEAGDWVELFGPRLPLDEVAATAGTIAYELLTGIGRRVERRYTS